MLDIIIVNWNTSVLLKKCIESIYDHCNESLYVFEITVIDNASTDDSLKMLEENFSKIRVIKNTSNLGFAKANNIAIERTLNKYILLLNSDTELVNNVFDKIIEYLETNANVGMIGCKLILPNGKRQIGDAGFEPTVTTSFNYSFFLSRLMPSIFHGIFHNDNDTKKPIEVDWVSGAALVVRRDVVKKLGPLTENFFMYAEDIEWGIRLKKNGWRVIYLPSAEVMHHLGGSCSNESKTVSTTWIENLLLFARNSNPLIRYKLIVLFLSCGYLLRSIMYKLKGMFSRDQSAEKQFRITYSAYKSSLSKILS